MRAAPGLLAAVLFVVAGCASGPGPFTPEAAAECGDSVIQETASTSACIPATWTLGQATAGTEWYVVAPIVGGDAFRENVNLVWRAESDPPSLTQLAKLQEQALAGSLEGYTHDGTTNCALGRHPAKCVEYHYTSGNALLHGLQYGAVVGHHIAFLTYTGNDPDHAGRLDEAQDIAASMRFQAA